MISAWLVVMAVPLGIVILAGLSTCQVPSVRVLPENWAGLLANAIVPTATLTVPVLLNEGLMVEIPAPEIFRKIPLFTMLEGVPVDRKSTRLNSSHRT